MKKLNYIVAFFLVLGLTAIISCGDDQPPAVDEVQLQLDRLSRTWSTSTSSSVTFESEDVTADWTAFSITFNGDKTYSIAGADDSRTVPVFQPNGGNWDFANPTVDLTQIKFGTDARIVTAIVDNGGTVLDLSFTLDSETTLGRVFGVDGDWVFNDLTAN